MRLWWVRACVRVCERERARESEGDTEIVQEVAFWGWLCVSLHLRVSGTACMNVWVHVCTLMWVFHEK